MACARRGLTAIALVLAVPAPAAADVTLTRARVAVTVEPNGIVDVSEQRLIHAATPYTAAVEVLMRQGELFAEPGVVVSRRTFRAGDGRATSTFLVSKGKRGIRVEWRQPRGTKNATLSYRLALRGIAYRDVVDLRLMLWNGGAALRQLDATVALPRAPRGRVYVWLDPRPTAATVTTAGKRISVHARDLEAKESLALRIAIPRAVLASTSGMIVRPQAGLQMIAAEEARPAHHTNWTAAVAGVTLAAVLVFAAVIYRGRRRNS